MTPRAHLILEHGNQVINIGTVGGFWKGWTDGDMWQSHIARHNIRYTSRNAVLQHAFGVA